MRLCATCYEIDHTCSLDTTGVFGMFNFIKTTPTMTGVSKCLDLETIARDLSKILDGDPQLIDLRESLCDTRVQKELMEIIAEYDRIFPEKPILPVQLVILGTLVRPLWSNCQIHPEIAESPGWIVGCQPNLALVTRIFLATRRYLPQQSKGRHP